jgi:CO/xanthine dehydrogenase Mo-binding subunit
MMNAKPAPVFPRGIVPSMNTPFLDDGTVDLDAVRRSAERVIADGVAGLLVLAVAAATASLDLDEKRAIASNFIAQVANRVPVHATGPYAVPHVHARGRAWFTNEPVAGAFRGFGANQAQFAMEGVLDRLAELVGITGWEIRKRNVIHPGEVWGPGQIMDDGCGGAEACLDAMQPHYDAARAAGRAVGIGLGLKNSGLGNGFRELSRAVVRFRTPVGGEAGGIQALERDEDLARYIL